MCVQTLQCVYSLGGVVGIMTMTFNFLRAEMGISSETGAWRSFVHLVLWLKKRISSIFF